MRDISVTSVGCGMTATLGQMGEAGQCTAAPFQIIRFKIRIQIRSTRIVLKMRGFEGGFHRCYVPSQAVDWGCGKLRPSFILF